ncbi:HAD family hydrolase [Terriglobus albidus]|uniref:HAD family hydrolase n=1 Tax=Terriglobus albidus TaxID=1592106 RepID=UPI0021DFF5D4|nr:HAD hydrolase-like protein [Terriglobus albidus]
MRENWDRFDAYLFDIDGTLLECVDAVHYFAFCDVLTTIAGRPMNLDGVTTHGNTDIGILRDALRQGGLPDEMWRDRLAEMRSQMATYVNARIEQVCARPHKAIHKALLHLRSRRAYLGVATGNLEAIGTIKLRSAGLFEYFQFAAWSDRHEIRRDVFAEALARVREDMGKDTSILIVGDTPADIEAAKYHHVPVLAVATGIFSAVELAACSPEICLNSFSDLMG